jgi:tripartite-type tricarboxylate transporter receptor subunit TctC
VLRGLVVPKGTPTAVKTKLESSCTAAAKEADFAAAMKKQGTRVAYLNAADYGKFFDKIDAENKAIMTELGLAKK